MYISKYFCSCVLNTKKTLHHSQLCTKGTSKALQGLDTIADNELRATHFHLMCGAMLCRAGWIVFSGPWFQRFDVVLRVKRFGGGASLISFVADCNRDDVLREMMKYQCNQSYRAGMMAFGGVKKTKSKQKISNCLIALKANKTYWKNTSTDQKRALKSPLKRRNFSLIWGTA